MKLIPKLVFILLKFWDNLNLTVSEIIKNNNSDYVLILDLYSINYVLI